MADGDIRRRAEVFSAGGGARRVRGAGGASTRRRLEPGSTRRPRPAAVSGMSPLGPFSKMTQRKGWSTLMPHGAEGRSDEEDEYELTCTGIAFTGYYKGYSYGSFSHGFTMAVT